jgi:esterase/lipase
MQISGLMRLAEEQLRPIVKDRLDRIHSPVLIIQSRNDKVSGSKSGPLAYRGVSSSEKRLVMLEHSGHSIMMGVEHESVFRQVIGFVKGETIR